MKPNRIKLSNIFKRLHCAMTECESDLRYDFYSHRDLVVRFSDLELSSDAGILLARQAEQQRQVCQGVTVQGVDKI